MINKLKNIQISHDFICNAVALYINRYVSDSTKVKILFIGRESLQTIENADFVVTQWSLVSNGRINIRGLYNKNKSKVHEYEGQILYFKHFEVWMRKNKLLKQLEKIDEK